MWKVKGSKITGNKHWKKLQYRDAIRDELAGLPEVKEREIMSLNIIQQHITKNQSYVNNINKADSRYTNFQKNGAKGAVLHSVGAAQPSAKVFANYFNNPNLEASVHAVLQADGTVYQLAPWNYRMWHVGGIANNTHIGVEMTEPDCIWYDAQNGYKLHIKDRDKALAFVKQTYAVAV